MNQNLCICRNEVIIEGKNVGQFESFEMKASSRTLGNTAELVIPLYAIGTSNTYGVASSRMRTVFKDNIIKTCAEVEVYCWFEGMPKELVFKGFVEHIVSGFPTKLYLQDNSFILRFGSIQKAWNTNSTLQSIIKDVIPIAQDAFNKEREKNGFTRPIPQLTYSTEKKNVQAVTTALSFRNWGASSPFDTVQKLMSLLVLYGGVSDDFNVYVGSGVTKSTRPLIKLDTRFNVVGRDIVPIDGRFLDYDVKITGVLSNGRHYTATGGFGQSKGKTTKSNFEKSYGETFRGFSVLNSEAGIQDFADRQLANLKGVRNKGSITLTMYPKVQIMDWVTYNDSVFPELSGGYYVLGYVFKASEEGYFQYLEITDQIFSL